MPSPPPGSRSRRRSCASVVLGKAGEVAAIIPCIRVAVTDALGNSRELMITSRMMRAEPSRTAGWTVYTYDAGLPAGATIDGIDIGVHAEQAGDGSVRVLFDDVRVNGKVFMHPGDNAAAEPPDPI